MVGLDKLLVANFTLEPADGVVDEHVLLQAPLLHEAFAAHCARELPL